MALRNVGRILFASWGILVFSAGLPGAFAADAPAKTVTVGITQVPPFVIHNADGSWSGISVDLWKQIAAGAGYRYQFRPMDFNQLLKSVSDGDVDVAVGALTTTAARESRFDFTQPFYMTGLAIGVPHAHNGGWFATIRRFVSWQFLSIVLALTVLLLLVGFLVWLFERRANPDEFGGRGAGGIGASFWWAAVTMTTVGYGDKSPRTLGGRLIGLVWMFAGIIMVSGFTAAITSSLTVSHLQHNIQGPSDLRHATVATIHNTISDQYLQTNRIREMFYPNLTQAIQAVADGRADAIVYDKPLLQYRARQIFSPGIDILPGVFERQNYAFALPTNSPLREPIDVQLLRVISGDSWKDSVNRYLGAAE